MKEMLVEVVCLIVKKEVHLDWKELVFPGNILGGHFFGEQSIRDFLIYFSFTIVCLYYFRSGGEQVEKLCSLNGVSDGDAQIPGSPVPGLGSQAWSVVWAPENDSHLVTLVDNHIFYWDVEAAGRSAKVIVLALLLIIL